MLNRQTGNHQTLKKLRKEWAIFALLSISFLTAVFTLLSFNWGKPFTTLWVFFSAAAVIYQLSVLWLSLPHNHRQGETDVLPGLGWGNRLTLLRGLLIAGLIGFLALPSPPGWLAWLPGIFYTLAIAADFFDGYLARITRHTTRLGEILDMSFDGLGILAAIILAVSYGRLPAWYLLVAFARYAFILGLWLRSRLGKQNYELPPSVRRRALAGFQMGFLAVMLWPIFSPPGTHIAALFFGLPILLGFVQDWLYASGVLIPGTRPTSPSFQWIKRWLPLFFRFGVVILGSTYTFSNLLVLAQLPAHQVVLTIADLLVISLLAVGITTRTAAIAGLILLGFHQVFASLSPAQILMAGGYSMILFLGGGPFSLWTPEEYLVYNRAGEPAALKVEQG
jgi:CDP-diacylglycerol--glycerol-3-phosphate 3-phosphatidyltransferase